MRGVISIRSVFSVGLSLVILCSIFLSPSPGLAEPGAFPGQSEHNSPFLPPNPGPGSELAEMLPRAYLPVLLKCFNSPAGIYGYASQAGLPAGGITIKLFHRVGSVDSQEAVTTTNACGYFSFINIPTVNEGSGQGYFARFTNIGIPNSLLQWETKVITPYTINQVVKIGTFDIGDITLLYPTTSTPALSLPVTFHWTERTQSPTDSYKFFIRDYPSYQVKYQSPPLGFTDNIEIKNSDLPSDMVSGKMYYWYVSILAPDGATGLVSQMQGVTFSIP